MRIYLIAVGGHVPAWVRSGFEDYADRLPPQFRLSLREVAAGRRSKGADIARLLREEGDRLMAAVPKHCRRVAFDRVGRALDTQELAVELRRQMSLGEDLALLVGGPEGLSPELLKRVPTHWSLSRLTLAHPLVRVVVAEQIYRAWSILNHLPYHR